MLISRHGMPIVLFVRVFADASSSFPAHRDSDEILALCCLLLGAIPPSIYRCNRNQFLIPAAKVRQIFYTNKL